MPCVPMVYDSERATHKQEHSLLAVNGRVDWAGVKNRQGKPLAPHVSNAIIE